MPHFSLCPTPPPFCPIWVFWLQAGSWKILKLIVKLNVQCHRSYSQLEEKTQQCAEHNLKSWLKCNPMNCWLMKSKGEIRANENWITHYCKRGGLKNHCPKINIEKKSSISLNMKFMATVGALLTPSHVNDSSVLLRYVGSLPKNSGSDTEEPSVPSQVTSLQLDRTYSHTESDITKNDFKEDQRSTIRRQTASRFRSSFSWAASAGRSTKSACAHRCASACRIAWKT